MKVIDEALIRVHSDGWELLGQKCEACGHIAYPRKRVCPRCFSEELKEYPLSKRGVLHTFTYTYLGPKRFNLPYGMGFVDLPEGIRLLGLIDHPVAEREALKAGMAVELVLGEIAGAGSGEKVHSYMFRPQIEEGVG